MFGQDLNMSGTWKILYELLSALVYVHSLRDQFSKNLGAEKIKQKNVRVSKWEWDKYSNIYGKLGNVDKVWSL